MLKRLFKPEITDSRDIRRYVVTVTLACLAVTIPLEFLDWDMDVANFFALARSLTITILETVALAAPISHTIGRANLELRQAKIAAENASRIDHLTGLFNRRALTEKSACIGHAVCVLAIADIDLFKSVNDNYGHLQGDRVIVAVGQAMAEGFSGLGILARIGGEEFALLSESATLAEVLTRCEAVRRRIAETPMVVEGHAARVTISIGVADSKTGDTFDALYARADRALYLAKASGRNRILNFEDISELAPRLPLMEDLIRQARSA